MKTKIIFFLLLTLSHFALAEENPVQTGIKKYEGNIRFTYDPVLLPGNEPMGLVGVSYLYDIGTYGYGGIAGYGAVTGQRGGFFAGGIEAGLRRRVAPHWYVDAGMFVGGGGGGAAPQGGGLMLRPHAGLLYDLGAYRLGLGVSWLKYPNGAIDSRQWSLIFERPFTAFFASSPHGGAGVPPDVLPASARLAPTELNIVLRQYRPMGDSRDTGGQPLTDSSTLVGISLRRYRSSKYFYLLEAAGSAGGITDGYAEVLAGVGFRYALYGAKISAEGSLAVGAGGGGRVDTGGGALYRGEVGLGYRITPALVARVGMGYMGAPDGRYQAQTLSAQLGYRWNSAGAFGYGRVVRSDEPLETMGWRLRGVRQSYTNPAWKGVPRASTVNLLGIKADMVLSPRLYLTGQALAAYQGGAGGYAVGLLGAGVKFASGFYDRLSANAEIAVGVAGGGSIDVGGGAIAQPSAGIAYRYNENLSFNIGYGRIKALAGALDSPVYEIGLTYRFATLGKVEG